jgi:2-polyprenyl-6-methoxyphenol hydroxylase-like FAD-dependent oxidoreductase
VGINILPHAARELHEFGLAESLDACGVQITDLSYHNRFGQEIWREPRGITAGYRSPQYSIHRGDLLEVLHRAATARLGEQRFHFGSRLEPGDLDRIDADVVVACDRVHSVMRRVIAPDEGHRSGTASPCGAAPPWPSPSSAAGG